MIVQKLVRAWEQGELVVVAGTGVSIALTNNQISTVSWKGLIEDGFNFGITKGRITAGQFQNWRNQLQSTDIDEILGAAEFVTRKLDAPNGDLYARWLENAFKHLEPANAEMQTVIATLQRGGASICTTNYDSLLERVTGLPSVNVGDVVKVAQWMRKEQHGILHLHGSWDIPSSCVLGIRDYETTIRDEVRDLIQRSLSSLKQLLFIGCGGTFSDPNFSALIKWLRATLGAATPVHYALVTESEASKCHTDPGWHGFVEPLVYGTSHDDLAQYLSSQFAIRSKAKRLRAKAQPTNDGLEEQLRDYRAFLLRDCGQMTIEGVRADMDTAQRRFDLERLFVPLRLSEIPPEYLPSDPNRESKLRVWQEAHKEPLPFAKVFARRKRLALLALPGGGKSILLKRLAVAYSDATRRKTSDDSLPSLNLMPVLIRCREWRQHIRLPIPTLLGKFAEITGQVKLTGLREALLPILKQGRVLLLVDGLDEIHDDGDRAVFVDNLESFLDQFKAIRVVVTSREAGFSLVAPCLARFCKAYRVAPLEENAIMALCHHWHRLMTGDSPESLTEGRSVADLLLRNESLRRLAENPLLLTMLLVVKHGAGRLPPDRVSLYERAVEVLLDTWNIKGHDALNVKEAVPQLACVAFELMRAGKQTATGGELLRLLEEARERIPHIRRHAKDSAHQFLKRVELRSSLLLEAGHQIENGRAVPFYQFRHLTFQEYLVAVAVTQGHYVGYEKSDTVLTPLANHLVAEEWKEVIPMAAVLSGKQAEPLIASLVAAGDVLRKKLESGVVETKERRGLHSAFPPPISRLIRCLVEEAEASPETLVPALQQIVLFSRGSFGTVGDLMALSRGPYGTEFLQQAWTIYTAMTWPEDSRVISTLALIAVFQRSVDHWHSDAGRRDLEALLHGEAEKENALGLLTCAGLYWTPLTDERPDKRREQVAQLLPHMEKHLHSDTPAVWVAATWAVALVYYHRQTSAHPTTAVLNRLLVLWLRSHNELAHHRATLALYPLLGISRTDWTPVLTEDEVSEVRRRAEAAKSPRDGHGDLEEWRRYDFVVTTMIGFHSKQIWPDEEIASRLHAARSIRGISNRHGRAINGMMAQLGEAGRRYSRSHRRSRSKHS